MYCSPKTPPAIFDFTPPEDSPVGDECPFGNVELSARYDPPRFQDYDMKEPCP